MQQHEAGREPRYRLARLAAREGGTRMVDRVVIVGAGVLGMMHAVQARSRGLSAVQLEREAAARGASLRNFGLIWISGRAPGAELALARRPRTLWEELPNAIPAAGFRSHGPLTVACGDPELGLLTEAAAMPDADLVVCRTGAAHTGIVGPHLAGYKLPPVRSVGLPMLQTAPFEQLLTTSRADGDSVRYYPAFDLPGRAMLWQQQPLGASAQLPFDHLRARSSCLLGAHPPPACGRWAGVFGQVTGSGLYHRSHVAPGVVLVTGSGGRGMTCARRARRRRSHERTTNRATASGSRPAHHGRLPGHGRYYGGR